MAERDRNHASWHASLRDDREASQEEILNQAKADHPEIFKNEKMYRDAVESVDRQVDKGAPHNVYSTYQQAGIDAERRQAIRDMARDRGQDEDEI